MPYRKIRNQFCKRDIVIGVGNDIGEVLEQIKKEYTGLEEIEFGGYGNPQARVYLKREYGAILIFSKKYVTGSVICHEVTHITNAFFEWMGIPLTDATDEAYAYHNDWMFTLVVETLKEMKAKVRI
jgi:hypothetical protein